MKNESLSNHDVLANLVITRVYLCTTMYNDTGTFSRQINRKRWAVVLKYEGSSVYYSCGREYLSDINNMVILPKGCSYDWRCKSAGRVCIIEFDSESTSEQILYFPSINGESLLKYFKELEYKSTVKNGIYMPESIRDTYSIIIKLFSLSAESKKYIPGKKSEKILPAIEYIAKNYSLKITNTMLAELAGVSTVYFRKLFAEVCGCAPIEYVHALRIKKAKEMLKSDYGTMSDIALALGYINIYDFSRDFKKRVGVSPTAYKKETV